MKLMHAVILLVLLWVIPSVAQGGKPPNRIDGDTMPIVQVAPKPSEEKKEDEVIAKFRSRALLCLHLLETHKSQPHIVLSEESVERLKVALKFTRLLKATEDDFKLNFAPVEIENGLPIATPVKDAEIGREALSAILINEDAILTLTKEEKNFDSDVVDVYRKVAGLPASFLVEAKPLIKRMEWATQNRLGQPDVRGSK